jgi:hypothetical protein
MFFFILVFYPSLILCLSLENSYAASYDHKILKQDIEGIKEWIKKEDFFIQDTDYLLKMIENLQDEYALSEEHLHQVFQKLIHEKNDFYHDFFDLNTKAKKYFAKNLLSKRRKTIHNQKNKIANCFENLNTLTVDRNHLLDKIIESRELLRMSQFEQNNLYAQMTSAKIDQHKRIPKESREQWDDNFLNKPLDCMQKRHCKSFFSAVLIEGQEKEPIKSICSGEVIFSDALKGLGYVIMVQHFNDYLSIYGNCQSLLKKVGDLVDTEEIIALIGHSGQLGENTLYFEMRHKDHVIALTQFLSIDN